MNIALGDHFEAFIQQQIENGSYASASEVVRAGLDQLKYEQERRDEILAMIDEAIASDDAGESIPINDLDQFFAEIRKDSLAELKREEEEAKRARAAS